MESKWTVRQRLAVATARDGGRAGRTTTGDYRHSKVLKEGTIPGKEMLLYQLTSSDLLQGKM